ncbi:MAG: DUF2924 domain-containing protein [Acidobacteria bacterium]|nr:DUF2924 domain-containing protein [Acidobacteriota bacterium]
MREWRTQSAVVRSRTDGFEYNSRIYKSLSAIAREVTMPHSSVNLSITFAIFNRSAFHCQPFCWLMTPLDITSPPI